LYPVSDPRVAPVPPVSQRSPHARRKNPTPLQQTCREINSFLLYNSSRLVLDLSKSRACPVHLPLRCVRLKNIVKRWRLVLVLVLAHVPFRRPFFSYGEHMAPNRPKGLPNRLRPSFPDRALSNSGYHPGVSRSNEFNRPACFVTALPTPPPDPCRCVEEERHHLLFHQCLKPSIVILNQRKFLVAPSISNDNVIPTVWFSKCIFSQNCPASAEIQKQQQSWKFAECSEH
jgi:hypothetical protein